jgi:hypothetical protein
MIDTNELRQRKAALVKDARAILDAASGAKRELTAEEKEKVDKMVVGAETLAAQLALEERLQKQDLDNAVVAEARDKAKVHGEFRSLAEFINAVRFNGADPRLVERRTEEVLAQMGDNAQGGYLVPPQFQAGILQVKPEDAIVRPRAQVIPAGFPPDSTLYIPALDQATYGMYGGVSVSWIEEGGAKPETKPKFDRVELTPHEVAATIPVTDKLLRNSAAFDPLARFQYPGCQGNRGRCYLPGCSQYVCQPANGRRLCLDYQPDRIACAHGHGRWRGPSDMAAKRRARRTRPITWPALHTDWPHASSGHAGRRYPGRPEILPGQGWFRHLP